MSGRSATCQCFALLYVLLPEEKLAVEIREVDGVEIEESDIAETSEHNVLYWNDIERKLDMEISTEVAW